MAVIAVWLKIDETRVVQTLQEAGKKLDHADGEVVLDFATVQRVDASIVKALDEFVRIADRKAVKVVLRGVNVDIYKVFKLMKLTQRVSFVI